MAAKKVDRFALLGAHLRKADTEGVEDVVAFDAGPLVVSAIAFDAGRGVADPETLRRAVAARSELIRRETFIAFRYGVTVSGAEEARTKCAPHLQRWRNLLEKRQGTVEVTLRIAPSQKPARPDRSSFHSGSEYLRALRQSRAPQLEEPTRRRIESTFRPFVLADRWLSREDGGSEFVALIERKRLDQVRAAGAALQKELPATPFILSGPWPLETFVDEEG